MIDNDPPKDKKSFLNLFKKRISSNQIVAVSALLISSCALLVSIVEMRTMKVQQKAMVYPHLDFGERYNSNGFSIIAKNTGTGLAIINSVEVFDGDRNFNNWLDIIDHYMPPDHGIDYDVMGSTQINGKVIPAGEEVRVFFIPWSDKSRALVNRLINLDYRICYCSLLEDCWEITKDKQFPASIGKCEFNTEVSF